MYNSVLRAFLISYFLVATNVIYGIVNASFNNSEDTINFVGGLVTIVILILFPIMSHRFLLKNKKKLGDKEFREKYSSLYTNVRYENSTSLRFTLYFCLRRLAFAFAIIAVKDSLVLQILISDFAVLSMLCFYVGTKPMDGGMNNFI